jgi:hypothetical protein
MARRLWSACQSSTTDPRVSEAPKAQPPEGLGRFDLRQDGGDGGNRTRVRNRVRMASTSVAGALISSPTRLAGGVVGDQPPWISPDWRRRTAPGDPTF